MEETGKVRPRREVIMRFVQPLAALGVRLLYPTGLNPLVIVLVHALFGLIAAGFIVAGSYADFILAALLLQLKTLLDNIDGGLARVSGRVTMMGRYFDTGMDFFVNIALFAALARYGSPLLSLLAFLLLTFMLSLDYNAERLYKLERYGPPKESAHPIGAPMPLYRFFQGLYDTVLAPQDRFIARLDRAQFEQLSGLEPERAPLELRLAWADMFSTAALVNLGLSTQMALLGFCLILGQPFWYVYAIFWQALYVLAVQLVRGWRFRKYLRRVEQHA